MCGITGFWLNTPIASDQGAQALGRMTRTLQHRGPDGEGVWLEGSVGLGHRRLAIQDTSTAGHQPMASASGRWIVTYNGELYGFGDLKRQLIQSGVQLKGHSDTEVLVEAIDHLGLYETLTRIQGMYAFAVWDRQRQRLTLVRDRLGIKPLYYGWRDEGFLFGSELKSIRAFPDFVSKREPRAVAELLKFGYIPAPLSIEKDIFKLMPGQLLELNASNQRPQPTTYWNLWHDSIVPGQKHPVPGQEPNATDPKSVVDQFDQLLQTVVSEHLISDVPLGAFLSGGIDSSLVVAAMKHVADGPNVKTFSIGFEIPEFNEAPYAQRVAEHLGTDHQQWILSSRDVQEVVPRLASIYDEPFADSSQIPTLLVSEFAARSVTVVLSGDGGDEFFGGYRRYPYFLQLWQRRNRIPGWLRTALGHGAGWMVPLCPPSRRLGLQWRSRLLRTTDFATCYEEANRHWKFPVSMLNPEPFAGMDDPEDVSQLVPAALLPPDAMDRQQRNGDPIGWMMLHDALRYLPDDILTKVDRASMACHLEARVPLLDQRIVDFSNRLGAEWKQGHHPVATDQNGKVLLRQTLARYLPRSLFERPKVGFGVPLGEWLRGDLRDWAESLLDPTLLEQQGIFQVEPLRRVWDDHQAGKSDQAYLLWDVLMFQASGGADW